MGTWAQRGPAVHPAWAARSDLPRPLGPQAAPPPQPGLGHLGPQVGADSRVPASASCSTPPPHPKSPPPSPRSSLSEAQRPRLLHPTPRLRSQPPVLPTPSSRRPGSQCSARPRSPCVLRGRRRGEAASAAGEVGAEAHRGAEARREETWREGRSLDSGGPGTRAPGKAQRSAGARNGEGRHG